jgi:PKD repeat protein
MNGTIWQNMSIVNTSIKTGYITVTEPAPVAAFTHVPSEGFYPLTVTFTDTSTNTPTAWNWSFGDGSLSTDQDVTHVYSSGGTYQVNLTVKNTNATYSTKLGSVEVWNYTTSDFTGTPTSGVVPLTVTFTDTSSNATNWSWRFGDSGTSIVKSPSYTYNTVGTYSVNHSANNTHDISWTNRSNYITVNPMVASFTNTTGTGVVPLSVTFNGTSTGSPNTWYWSFGDGSTSTSQNVTHIYTVVGIYGVNFRATNTSSGAFDWENKTNYISVLSALLAQYKPGKTVSIWYPAGIFYNDTSLGTPTSWNWTFGDGTNSTRQNPYKQWRAPGVYHVRLTESNAYETSSNSSWVQVLKWN